MRRRPDPDQALFPWVWSDSPVDRPDGPEDDDMAEPEPTPPPLRDRVRQSHAPTVMRELWGTPIRVKKARDPRP